MSRTGPLYDWTALALGQGYGEGKVTPRQVLDAIHARVDAINPAINAIIAEDRAAARRAADASTRRWAEGAPLSPLDGVPITVKDNIHVAGLPARWGSALHDDGAETADEPAIEKLRAAGLVLLGKTNVPEFTLQGYTDNALFGVTRNPLAPDRTPGGSTGGGAAAVASGMAPLAIGTDGGGSIRRPAAHCGLYGFKPSIGQIARSGGFPQILADFEVIGPLARTPQDLAALFDILSGPDPRDPKSLIADIPAKPMPAAPRIGYFRSVGTAPVDPQIIAASDLFAQSLGDAGCQVEDIPAPFDPAIVNTNWGIIAQAGLAWHLAHYPHAEAAIGANARAMAASSAALSAADLFDALTRCMELRSKASILLSRYDMLLCPSTAALAWPAADPFPPFIAGREAGPRGHALFTAWMNVTGLAAVSVPIALTSDSGGIGMQFVTATGRDRALLDFLVSNPAFHALPAGSPAKDLP